MQSLLKILENLRRNIFHRKGRNGNGARKKDVERCVWLIVIGLALTILISLMLPRGRSFKYSDLKEGEVYVGDEIIAPFTFPINKTDDEYQRDLRRAASEVMPVFVRNDSIRSLELTSIEVFFDSLNAMAKEADETNLSKKLSHLLADYKINSSEEILSLLLQEMKNKTLGELEQRAIRIARDITSVGILDQPRESVRAVNGKISVVTDVEEIISELSDFYDPSQIGDVLLEKLRTEFENDDLKVKAGYEILRVFLRPTIIFDPNETHRNIEEAKKNVPLAKGTVLANERIIDRYERVTKAHIAKLNSLAIELAERESDKRGILGVFHFFSRFFLIMLVLSIFVMYLFFTQRSVMYDLNRAILIALIFFLVSFVSFYINRFHLSPYLMPITIGSMLLAIFLGTRIGIVGTITLSLLLGSLRGNEFNIALISMVVGVVAVLSVSRIRKRNWLINSIALIIGSYLISITVVEILHYTPWRKIFQYWMYGAINGFLSPLFAYGLQVLFENIFDLVTDMKLLELSDLNSPLLRKMSIQAPGTYHHSLMVGNLAEAAAEAIGANSLLARVGSYYHDIGKIEKPEYFIENQTKNRNPHEKLSPSMSCLILSNHVRSGLELAKEYKLPREIRDFIAEHHGTSKMEYFYQKALEMGNEEEIEETNFRYPGPKPRTKETGIVMLADAVEATSRTLKDPSVSRIRGMVISIVQRRFQESELDDSPLTLRDLTKITESFEAVLLSTFHGRIEYPDQEEKLIPSKEKKEKQADG
ncbi:MAG: HDIG domain-containing protein [Calditrichaeota bacterium]|nr:HDIG domain-containing protein [Calditrichota bacterium]